MLCRFVCTWSQTGRGGALLYTGRHASPPLQVVMAPSLLLEMEPGHAHLDTPSTVTTITPQFMARPVPRPQELAWTLVTANLTSLDLAEAAEAGVADSEVGAVRRAASSSNPDEWEVELRLWNLTENVTLWFHAENRAGSMDQMFTVSLVSPALGEEASLQQYHAPGPRWRPWSPRAAPHLCVAGTGWRWRGCGWRGWWRWWCSRWCWSR